MHRSTLFFVRSRILHDPDFPNQEASKTKKTVQNYRVRLASTLVVRLSSQRSRVSELLAKVNGSIPAEPVPTNTD